MKKYTSMASRHIVLVLAIVIFLASCVFAIVRSAHDRSDESNARSQVHTAKSLLSKAKDDKDAASSKLNTALSGVSDQRKAQDDAVITKLMTTATTWSSYKQYQTARETIHNGYHLSYTSSFLKAFLPPINSITDGTGKSYNVIDQYGYNMSFENMTTYLTNIDGPNYTYLALVSVNSYTGNHKGSSTTYDAVRYTLTVSHTLVSIDAWPISTQPQSLGSFS